MKNKLFKLLLVTSFLSSTYGSDRSLNINPGENVLANAQHAPRHSAKRQRYLKNYYDNFLLPEVRRLSNGGYHAISFAWQSYRNLKLSLPNLTEENFLNSRDLLAQQISRSIANTIIPPGENILVNAQHAPAHSDERQRYLKDYYNNFLLPEVRRLSNGSYHATSFAWQNYDNLKQTLSDLSEEDFLNSRDLLAQQISRSMADAIIPPGKNILANAQHAPRHSAERQRYLRDYYDNFLLPEVRRLSNSGYHATSFAWQNYDNLKQSLPNLSEEDFLNSRYILMTYADHTIANAVVPPREDILLNAWQAPRYSAERQRYLKDYYDNFLLPEVRRLSNGGYHATAFAWQNYDNLKQSLSNLSEENFLNSRDLLAQQINVSVADIIIPSEGILFRAWQAPRYSIERQRYLKDYYDNFLLPKVRNLSSGGYHATAFAWQSYDNLKQALPNLSEENFLNSREFVAQYISFISVDSIISEESERIQEIRVAAAQMETQRLEEIRFAFNDARPARWIDMNTAQQILFIADEMFQRPNFRTLHGLPSDINQQFLLKNKLQELMTDNYIDIDSIVLPLAAPQNIALVINRIAPILITTMNIQKYENAPFNMVRQEAKDFNTFVIECNKLIEFPLAFEKKLSFYRNLKVSFSGTPWRNITEVLKIILQNSLPMDYAEWPNFDEHPEANLEIFTQNIMAPCINAIRGNLNIEEVSKNYVDNLLTARQRSLRENIDRKIGVYQNLNNNYILAQKNTYGDRKPLSNTPQRHISFKDLTEDIYYKLLNLEDQTRDNINLNQRINFTNFCSDPFLSLLRAPDEKLIPLTQNYGNHFAEVQTLIYRIINLIPANERGLDEEFRNSFGSSGFGLGHNNDLNKTTMIRIKRLYNCIKENTNELTAAKVIYNFGAENTDRCVDGKRDRITDLEREYVYIANGLTVNRDMDATIGLNLSKLFMDDRMNTLRKTINALYIAGEPRTYAWVRSHRAIYLGFGLSGKYEDMIYGNFHNEGVDPVEFVEKYFKGGAISGLGSMCTYNIEAFTINKMVDIVSQEIQKTMGGLFDDEILNYMINSNLDLRHAYIEFQRNEGNEGFENDYFQNPTLSQRHSLKKEAIIKVLKNYKYIYVRNGENDHWE